MKDLRQFMGIMKQKLDFEFNDFEFNRRYWWLRSTTDKYESCAGGVNLSDLVVTYVSCDYGVFPICMI